MLPTFGNHDYAPSNDFPDTESTIYSKVFKFWQPWIGNDYKVNFYIFILFIIVSIE